MKVLGNWLLLLKKFEFDCFLRVVGLYLAIPRGNFVVSYSLILCSFFANLNHLDLAFCKGGYGRTCQNEGQANQGEAKAYKRC